MLGLAKPETILNFGMIKFPEHKINLPVDSKLYRCVTVGWDPFRPTGREMRFVTEPSGFDESKYIPGVLEMGSGAICVAYTLYTANLETAHLQQKDQYEFTLRRAIDIYDLASICKKQGVDRPMENLKAEDFTEFYGRRIPGLRYESVKVPAEYNIVIYHDWFPEFKNLVSFRKI